MADSSRPFQLHVATPIVIEFEAIDGLRYRVKLGLAVQDVTQVGVDQLGRPQAKVECGVIAGEPERVSRLVADLFKKPES